MAGLKSTVVRRATGTAVQFRPIVLSFDLTPHQRMLIFNATGHYPTKLELSANDLKVILAQESVTLAIDWEYT